LPGTGKIYVPEKNTLEAMMATLGATVPFLTEETSPEGNIVFLTGPHTAVLNGASASLPFILLASLCCEGIAFLDRTAILAAEKAVASWQGDFLPAWRKVAWQRDLGPDEGEDE
jgi:hypothetical protein